MFTFKNSEVTWTLVPSGAQVQPKIILDPDYLPGYLSVSYDYSLRQFVTTESSLNMMKSASYFMLKALFILKIFTFFSYHFGHAGVNFKIYDVTDWTANTYYTHTAQYHQM